MKILQVITSLKVGGAEKLLVDMVPLLIQKGHQVDVLLFNGEGTPLAELLEQKGVRIFKLSNGGNVYNPLFIFKLSPFLKGYDVIHTHNAACQYFVALAKKIFSSSSKLLTTEHSTSNRRRKIKWFKVLDMWMYKQYECVISISNKATELLANYMKGISVITIMNGVNLTEFRNVHSSCQKKYGEIILVMVAGFRKAKDQDTLIRAMALLPESYHLWLVGDGERRDFCQNLAREYNVSERVSFLGIRTDIPQILSASDVVIMSSHYEGLSLSSIEGMAVGKPFVASDVDGLHEIVEGAGLLFEHGNETQLSEYILRLMSDKEYYLSVSEKCVERSLQYDISVTVEQYNNLYYQIIPK